MLKAKLSSAALHLRKEWVTESPELFEDLVETEDERTLEIMNAIADVLER